MALHQRNDRGDFVNPAGGGPRPKLKVKRGADGKLEVQDPEPGPKLAETRPDEKPAEPEDPRGPFINPHTQGF